MMKFWAWYMLRFTALILVLFSTSLIASASEFDAVAANLQSHGFACHATKTFRNCGVSGKLSDGKPYEVRVFAVRVRRKATEIEIFVQPAAAAKSAEVGRIYDSLARSFAYDKGKLKDRFPNTKSLTEWCDAKGIHNLGRCTVNDGLAEFRVSTPPNVDQWSLGWTTSQVE
jgi:hypothetical protein